MRGLGECLGLLAALLVATSASAQDQPRKWGPFLDLEGDVGTKRNLGEADLFVPLWQDSRSMVFGDARFKVDDQSSWEGNWGVGMRRMLADGWNIGGYGYYDHRRSPNANYFDQLTFGTELLGTNFDFRANSYWPVGNTAQQVGPSSTGATTAAVSGSTLQISTPATYASMEYALRGFDAEAGVRVPILPAESPYNLRFYAGGFRFDEPTGMAPVVAGPRLRLEFTDYHVPELWHGTRFTVGGEWETDAVRGSQFFAGLRLRVPLEAEATRRESTLQERRMTDPVIRDVDIVATTQTVAISPAITEVATSTANGQNLSVINASTTTGANLPTAVANAGANSTVLLSGTFNTTATTTLQSGQTVMGSGSLSVRTASGRTVTVTVPQGATLSAYFGGGGGQVVTMADNSTLTGMIITHTEGSSAGGILGVYAGRVSGATISNNTITATQTGSWTAFGVQAAYAQNLTITNNMITARGQDAIQLFNSSAVVSGNTLSASGGSYADLNRSTILSGSTGNVAQSGSCFNLSTIGTIYFVGGTTCP